MSKKIVTNFYGYNDGYDQIIANELHVLNELLSRKFKIKLDYEEDEEDEEE